MFYEHGNGNEAKVESLEATPPLVLNASQPNIIGYTNIGSASDTIQAFPLGFNATETKGQWPYVQQWNLNIQNELPQHFVSSIAYVGSKGTHLGMGRDINQLSHVPTSENPFGSGQTLGNTGPIIDPGTGQTAGACAGPGGDPLNPTTWEPGQTVVGTNMALTANAASRLNVACGSDPNPFRPYLGMGSVQFIQYEANSVYNALQATLSRTISPLTLSIAYTYSHSIDDSSDRFSASFVDAYDVARARASSNFDQRHMLNISYVYDLPFFRSASGWTNKFLGGWQWSGIASIQTGTPFNVVDSSFSDNAGVSNGYTPGTFADLVGSPSSTASASCAVTGAGPQLYDPCAFAHPRGLTFGDARRNILRNPRTTNFDMSLLKIFTFKEAKKLEFRAEAFNLFNHTQWSGVYNDLNSPDFLHPNGAHRARTLQFGLKFLF